MNTVKPDHMGTSIKQSPAVFVLTHLPEASDK